MKISRRNVRFNIVNTIIYLIGIILIIQLFNLQIIHGKEYLEQANLRLTRENTIKAARGNFLDRNGNLLAGSTYGYTLNLYKSKIDEYALNNIILNAINVLEKNKDEYIDSFPIDIDPYQYKINDPKKWLKANDLDENLNAKQAFLKYVEKYNLEHMSIEDANKVIAVRYGLEKEGYSSMRAYTIARNISKESMYEFEEKNLDFAGISIEYEPLRTYKYGALASHILGYIGKINEEEYNENEGYGLNDYIGKTGLEYVMEGYLKGKNGVKQTDMSIEGTTTAEYITEEAIGGSTIVLTIDAKIQEIAEKSLKANIEKINSGGFGAQHDTETGVVIVLDVKTGEVIAMCSYPDFEPALFMNGISNAKWNEYTAPGKSALLNRAMQSAYAPGSIFKMVSAIAGLETGNITIKEKIRDLGVYPKGHNPKCWIWTGYGRTHGNINVSDAIKHSCNYFFYELATRMGIEPLEKYATYFGLGQKTNIELPGEISGTLAGKRLYTKLGKTWYYGNTLSAIIGQAENNFTPIQIAKYIAMLANGGNNIDITLIKDVVNTDGTKVDRVEVNEYVNKRLGLKDSEVEDIQINSDNLNAVLEGMKSVTTETGGTAYSVFKDFPIEVGGKTGSAEAGDKVNAWFAGFAPFENPEIAVVVLVENGTHGYYTAEVVRDILEAYFGLNQDIEENKEVVSYTGVN